MGTKSHILLVEDSRFMRTAVAAMLSANGFRVTTAADGEQAVDVTEQQIPDLIVMDWFIPKLRGLELIQKFKSSSRTAHVPIVILSGAGKADDLQQALSKGAVGFIDKTSLSLEGMLGQITSFLRPATSPV
jgi:two-component system phosphate regulon response regulator PhoB